MADAAAVALVKKLMLRSSDGEEFVVEETVAMELQTIKRMVEDDCADSIIPVPNVKAGILTMVINYCQQHVQKHGAEATNSIAKTSEQDLKTFDEEFVDVGQHILFDLIMAVNYLDIKGLLDLTCQKVADKIKEMTPEEIRKTLNIKNDFTKEEEDELWRKNQWAFE